MHLPSVINNGGSLQWVQCDSSSAYSAPRLAEHFTSSQATKGCWEVFINPVVTEGLEVEGEQNEVPWKWSKMFYYCNYD